MNATRLHFDSLKRRCVAALRRWQFALRDGLERLKPSSYGLYRLRGELIPGGTRLTVLFVGRRFLAEDLCTVFFPGPCELTHEGPATAWNAYETAMAARREEDDVAVIDELWPQGLGQGAHWLSTVVVAELDPGSCPDTYVRERVALKHRQALNRARKLGMRFRKSDRADELRFFYDELMVPATKSRHGDKSHLPEFEYFERLMRTSELYFLERDQEIIGGYLLVVSKVHSRAECLRFGYRTDVVERDPKLLKSINILVDDHAIQMTREHKLSTFSLGPTPPVLSNGLFHYKRRWGCTFKPPANHPRCRVEFLSSKKAQILRQRGLLLADGDGLYGLVAHEPSVAPLEGSENGLWHELKSACFPGLKAMRVLAAREHEHVQRLARSEPLPVPVQVEAP